MMMPDDWRPPTLFTPRLVVRPFVEADAGPLFGYAKNPNVTRYTLWDHHKTEAETLAFVRDYARLRYREGMAEPYAIAFATDPATPVGSCGCFWASQANRTMELGYWVAEPFWGQGIVVEACRAVIGYVFEEMKPERMQARVIAGNAPSGRVLEKLGFRYEGTLRAGHLRRGVFEDVMMYSLLRTEWDASPGGPA
jgi:ribosomal-protein-alanine N-acetyltransferase